jgi:hypothetical protein
MSAPDRRRGTSLHELRALQREEHAPAALRRRVLERLADEPATEAGGVVPLHAARRAVQPGWLALGALAAALALSLSHWLAAPQRREPELTLAPEPSEPAGSLPAPRAGTAVPQPGAANTEAERPRAPASAAATKARVSAAAVARKLAAPQPHPAPSTLGRPAPDLQPGLRRDRPAREMMLPGFAPTSRAVMSEGPLPAAIGANLVTNGDFSQGTALWSVRRWEDFVAPAPTELAPYDVVQGALCTTLHSGAIVIGGWPGGDRSLSPSFFALERGQRYRVSLRAWIKGPLQVALVFKVGHQDEPYDAALVAAVPVTQLPHRFSIPFEPHADDDNAGVGFVANAVANPATPFGSSDLCIDDVTLTREAHPL